MKPQCSSTASSRRYGSPTRSDIPNGVRAVTDYAKKHGMKTIVWFAPEHNPPRAEDGGDPKWTLTGPCEEPLARDSNVSVIDFGNPAAWKWLVDLIDARITSEGIACYRHDTGWGPLPAWKAHDAKDRQGITENHYVSRLPGVLRRASSPASRSLDRQLLPRRASERPGDHAPLRPPLAKRLDRAGRPAVHDLRHLALAALLRHGDRNRSTSSRSGASMSPSTAVVPDMRNKNCRLRVRAASAASNSESSSQTCWAITIR